MDKLSLQETLRIYLPGLLLSLLGNYLFFNSPDSSTVAVYAVFISIAFYLPCQYLSKIIFKVALEDKIFGGGKYKKTFFEEWATILVAQLRYYNFNEQADIVKHSDRIFLHGVILALFSKTYGSSELSFIRTPKSFGIMYAHLTIACIIALVIIYINEFIHFKKYEIYIPPILTTMMLLFAWGTKVYFIESLSREITYIKGLTEDEVKKLSKLVTLTKHSEMESETNVETSSPENTSNPVID